MCYAACCRGFSFGKANLYPSPLSSSCVTATHEFLLPDQWNLTHCTDQAQPSVFTNGMNNEHRCLMACGAPFPVVCVCVF